eukprot:Skav232887  [mRNA]  locus=scaffold5953:11724:16241:+ [translate_table: standard]
MPGDMKPWRNDLATLEVKSIGTTQCAMIAGNTPVVVHMSSQWCKQMVTGVQVTLSGFRVVWYEAELHFHCDESSLILFHPDARRGEKAMIEMFAGLAGWSNASGAMGKHVRMMVEKDLATARVCAQRFNIPMFTAEEFITAVLNGDVIDQCVLHDSVSNPRTWVAVGLINTNTVLASPPCQPWSGAGSSCGMMVEDGYLMTELLGWSGVLCIESVIIENVPGFRRHTDFAVVISEAQKDGMKLQLSEIIQCSGLLPVRRERWIGVFIHCTVPVQAGRVSLAAAVAFTDQSFKIIHKHPNIIDANVVHCNMSQAERDQLVIVPELREAMGKLDFAPGWLKCKVSGITPSELIQGRTIHRNEQYGAIMALYGRQHELSNDTLTERGLQTVIMNDGNHDRLISPWEFVAAMGFPSDVILHADIHKAWTMAGNSISVAHAWMAMHKAHVILEDRTPFQPTGNMVEQITQLLEQTIKMSDHETLIEGEFWKLMPVRESVEPNFKRSKLDCEPSPTQTFQIEQPEATEHQLETRFFPTAPAFEKFADPRQVAVQGIVYSNGLLILQHEQKHWVMFINAAKGDQIGNIIMRGLPHAREQHFAKLIHEGRELAWDVQLDYNKVQTVSFTPVPSIITCAEESLQIAMSLKCDLTWTAKSVLAYWATRMGCNVEAIKLMQQNRPLKDDDFVLEFPSPNFQVAFHTSLPMYADIAPCAKQVNDPGMATAPASFTRFFARHPCKKVARTAAVAMNATVLQLVQALFPDLHATTPWSAYGGEEQIPVDAFASAWNQFTIQWDTLRPLQTTEVQAIRFSCGWGSPATVAKVALDGVTKHVRSPFQVRAEDVIVPRDLVMGELAATYLCHSQIQASMMCSVNGAVVDPMNLVSEVDDRHVIQCRICPLLGGTKNDGLRKRLHDMLDSKGVPSDQVTDRLNAFIAKCPMEKLSVYKDNDDDQLWNHVKTMATAVKFRLIKTDELKAFQQKQRQSKASGASQVKKDHTKQSKSKEKQHMPQAHDIVVDPCHFAAEGEPIQILSLDRFGPDQAGLCITSPHQADKILQSHMKSCDPLALLVIGKGAEKHGAMFSMPAHTKQGAPVVISASLVQCGDVDIEFVLQIPKVSVAQAASTVIEFTIEKKFVSQWSAVQIPLHYLGVHIPPLRGSNLLAVWSVKPWAGSKLANHDSASHYHGFFRVNDNLLLQILARSGNSGIFLCPKTQQKKHDPRFVAIPMPGSLQDTLAKAEECKQSLGVVKMGTSFAIRCRREDSAMVRQQTMPETAFVDMVPFGHNDKLFILKFAPQINREELSDALKAAGWQAEAVKSQGLDRWIIASEADPPSSHLAINQNIVIIEPLHPEKTQKTTTVVATAREIKVDTVRDASNKVVQVTTSSRIQEMRAEIEEQISCVVDAKMEQANQQIATLTAALQDVQRESATDLHQLKAEQQFTKQKLTEMEQAMSASNQTILQQMKHMFQTMEQSMSSKMDQALAATHPLDPEKRARTENAEPKHDPFSGKSH